LQSPRGNEEGEVGLPGEIGGRGAEAIVVQMKITLCEGRKRGREGGRRKGRENQRERRKRDGVKNAHFDVGKLPLFNHDLELDFSSFNQE
jgi:hypothetical protein